MSVPISYFVPITGTVSSPAFTVEKLHMLLALKSDIMPTSTPFLEFTSASGFKAYFGSAIAEYTQVNKYFSLVSKSGKVPDKVVVANWYEEAKAPFIKVLR